MRAPEEKSGFQLPDEGQVGAVCADLIDLGEVETKWGKKHKVQFVFQIDQTEADGTRMQIRSFPMALASGKEASLQKFIEQWIRGGKKFTGVGTDKLSEIELEDLVGHPALISVVHEAVGDKTYANIGVIGQLPKGTPALKVEGYVRRVKKQKDEQASTRNTQAANVGKGEALPF